MIEHRLNIVNEDEARGLLSLLAVLTSEAQSILEDVDMITLKESLFVEPSAVKRLAMAQGLDSSIQSGLRELLQSSFDPRSTADRRILSEVSAHWLALLQTSLDSGTYDKVSAYVQVNELMVLIPALAW